MIVSRHHADWLSLVEVSGPFVSLPVLQRVFPQGLEPRDPAQAKLMRAAYEEWQDNPTGPGKQRAWVMHVLTGVLGYPHDQIVEGQKLPAGLKADMPEMSETLRPDFALVGPTGSDTTGQAQFLIASYPAEQVLDKSVIGKHWKAAPATRMMELLHGTDVPLGLVTNGEQWMLVYAPRGETTGYISWYGALWLDEPITLRAFHSLLGLRRFFGVGANSTLLALLKESATDQQEVTDQLGFQVREAVEVLVQCFDALDKEGNRSLLKAVPKTALYEAALTVMMRLVFLFSAEERGLLHLGKALYDDNYAVSTLQEQLQEIADRYGEEVLERRYDAWARLLATFRAVHSGTQHQDLLMRAYGGSLFDPDRYPFLEGRPAGSAWRRTAAEPLAVNNRVVLHLLNSLQRLRIRAGAAGTAETRRVSFRALGVEQIGHVYEGLLDHTALRANEPVLGIKGTRNKQQEIPLAKIESLQAEGQDKLIEFLKEETGRSVSALRRELEEGSLLDDHILSRACDHDAALLARVRPFANLIRRDSFERPMVILPGSVYVTLGTTRRSTGTHYTPPSLTEPIVQHTLESLVYDGPADGWPRQQWTLKSPKAILDIKVCDLAMGSGAFLVQACRYMAERLVEAWETLEKRYPDHVLITPEGEFSAGSPTERLVPADADERIAVARRVVADRCIYGVDINPMAVEMAKLSLWLITVQRDRPFTFLDHALKCGDSLLGVSSVRQIENFTLRPGERQVTFATANLYRYVEEASAKRRDLEYLPSNDSAQIETKNRLHAESEAATAKVKALADCLIAFELQGVAGEAYEEQHALAADNAEVAMSKSLQDFQNYVSQQLAGRRAFHWPVEFSEVFQRGGFDAVVGNPPFLGGRRIRSTLGLDYLKWLTLTLYPGTSGNADLCAFFFRRAFDVLRIDSSFGLLATNTISQADTRAVSLDALVSANGVITRAEPDAEWPGVAGVNISKVWVRKGPWSGERILGEHPVEKISPYLVQASQVEGNPHRLIANEERAYVGSFLCGNGFVLTEGEAKQLRSSPLNERVIFPYLTGQDVNSNPESNASRWVINFSDWPLTRGANGSWLTATQKMRDEWRKIGIVPNDYPDPVAADFPDCLRIIEGRVKPERTRRKADGQHALRKPLPQRWWLYADRRPALYRAIQGLERVLVTAEVSKNIQFAFCPADQVLSHMLIVFPTASYDIFAVLQSWVHCAWAWEHCSTMRAAGIRYSPTHAIETFPFPNSRDSLGGFGKSVYEARQRVIRDRKEGLTKLYNRIHARDEVAKDVRELRTLHVEMDQAVASAYGWNDLDLGHGFHEGKQGMRYTISGSARRAVLDRLLLLNHQRHAEEETAQVTPSGTHAVKQKRKKRNESENLTLDLL